MAPLTKCIQCQTTGCGWDVCRFSGMSHDQFRRVRDMVNAYAKAADQQPKRILPPDGRT